MLRLIYDLVPLLLLMMILIYIIYVYSGNGTIRTPNVRGIISNEINVSLLSGDFGNFDVA